MMVYLFGARKRTQELSPFFDKMTRMFVRANLEVVTNLRPKELEEAKRRAKEVEGMMLLDQINAFVIEASTPDPEIGYILAHAVVYKKPTLMIYTRGNAPRELLHNFKQRDVSSFLMFRIYTAHNLDRLLFDFLAWLDVMPEKDMPSIKFTLRLSPNISRFLEWKGAQMKLAKADFLRALIEGEMKDDRSFQQYLRDQQDTENPKASDPDQ
ncbi:MAG: hypothetical protein HYV34_04055 [Candidatus Kerfeldbacteria bacterium]|nr:hypothetical protein [Candidatus Kerfeldbacteria bacterium]